MRALISIKPIAAQKGARSPKVGIDADEDLFSAGQPRPRLDPGHHRPRVVAAVDSLQTIARQGVGAAHQADLRLIDMKTDRA